MYHVNSGKFITLEGPEGAGKSTLIKKIAEQLKRMNYEVFMTREPGGTPTGEMIRGILQHDHSGEALDPRTELLLFEASRAQLVGNVIKPKLKKGIWVLCDRFGDSTTAYQGYGRGFGYELVEKANEIATGDCVPDLTLLIDLPIEVGLKRISGRIGNNGKPQEKDTFEKLELEFHERVRKGYLDIAQRNYKRFAVIDGNQEPDQVYLKASRALFERLGL